MRVRQEPVRGHRPVRGQERHRHPRPGVERPGVRAHAQVPVGRAVHRVRRPAGLPGPVQARAVPVPVLGAARRERPRRHPERRGPVHGPHWRALAARHRAGEHDGTARPPDPAQDIRHRRENQPG